MKYIIVVAVCLFDMAVGSKDLFGGFKRSVRLQMRDAGQGACDVADPCDNGDCEEDENGEAICFCHYSYSGEFCDQICELDHCWADYWEEMEAFWGNDDDNDDDDDDEDDDEDDDKRPCASKRQTMTTSPGHLRRALHMKKRGSSLKKRTVNGKTYEEHCRVGISSLLQCLDESLADQSYCSTCTNDTVSWIADVITGRGKIADEYCSDSWECKEEEASQCVEKVNKMFEIHYGGDKSEQIKPDQAAAFHSHLDEVEGCLSKIVNGDLSLAGCIHNSWIKNELLLFLVEIIRAEVNGCNLTEVGYTCGLGAFFEDLDATCALTEAERGNLFDTSFQCAQLEATAKGSVCDGALDKLVPSKPHLLREAKKECGRIAAIDGILGACETKKHANKLNNLLRALNKKDEGTLLKELLRSLVKGHK